MPAYSVYFPREALPFKRVTKVLFTRKSQVVKYLRLTGPRQFLPPVIAIAIERVNLTSLKSARKPGEFNSPYE